MLHMCSHVARARGWPLRFADELRQAPEPSPEVVALLREKLDPQRLYL